MATDTVIPSAPTLPFTSTDLLFNAFSRPQKDIVQTLNFKDGFLKRFFTLTHLMVSAHLECINSKLNLKYPFEMFIYRHLLMTMPCNLACL